MGVSMQPLPRRQRADFSDYLADLRGDRTQGHVARLAGIESKVVAYFEDCPACPLASEARRGDLGIFELEHQGTLQYSAPNALDFRNQRSPVSFDNGLQRFEALDEWSNFAKVVADGLDTAQRVRQHRAAVGRVAGERSERGGILGYGSHVAADQRMKGFTVVHIYSSLIGFSVRVGLVLFAAPAEQHRCEDHDE